MLKQDARFDLVPGVQAEAGGVNPERHSVLRDREANQQGCPGHPRIVFSTNRPDVLKRWAPPGAQVSGANSPVLAPGIHLDSGLLRISRDADLGEKRPDKLCLQPRTTR